MCAARQMMRTQESNASDDVARGDISLSSAFSTSTWHHGNVHVCDHDLLILLLLMVMVTVVVVCFDYSPKC